jgi:uncharacterized membrane protein YccC
VPTKRLTLSQVSKLARSKDKATWDKMSKSERQLLVDMLNQHASEMANERFFEAIQAPALKEMAERKLVRRRKKR